MWDWFKDAIGKQGRPAAKASNAAKASGAAKASSAARGKGSEGRQESAAGKRVAEGAGAAMTASEQAGAFRTRPVDPAERDLETEKAAVRESFRSDPATVVAVLRSWLREDAQKAAIAQGSGQNPRGPGAPG